MLASGIAGIREGLEPPDPVNYCNLFDPAQFDSSRSEHDRLPCTLADAIERFEGSQLMRETLGEHIHSYLVREKKIEWAEYNKTVSDWELKRYLPLM